MRTDKEPFTDKRVRQAIALSLDRAGPRRRASGRDGPTSATTAPSRPSTHPPTRPCRSGSRTSSRPASSSPTPAWRASRYSSTPGTASRSPTSPSSSRAPPQRSGSPSTSRSPTPARTTATASSATRPGSTPSWASPTTATGRCRTSTSPRRSPAIRRSASGTRRTSRTTTLDELVAPVRRRARRRLPEGRREADPGAAARRDADHLPVLLQLPQRREAESPERGLRGDMGQFDLSKAGFTRLTEQRRPRLRARAPQLQFLRTIARMR